MRTFPAIASNALLVVTTLAIVTGRAGSQPASTPIPSPSAPTASKLLWQIGDDAVTANTGQCGTASYPGANAADFTLTRNGVSCERNQLNPVGNGGSGVYLLTAGKTYTWRFQTVTRMGVDAGKFTQRLIWQIHDYACGSSPNTVLGIQNMTGGNNGQTWYLQNGSTVYALPYVEGATDTWKITAKIASDSSGSVTWWHNGAKVGSSRGPNFDCGAAPWWNFGPYMWNWAGRGSGTSSLAGIGIRFNYMQLTTP